MASCSPHSTEDRDGSEAVAAPWKLKSNLWKCSDGCPPKKTTGVFVWFSWKMGKLFFLFLVYKWFTLNDPPNFMSFTYFVGFIILLNKYVWIQNRLSLSWCVFCPQLLGENNSWQNLTDTGIFKAFGWPSKNEHFYIHFLPWKKESHLQPVCW